MDRPRIVIIDYQLGNLFSVQRAFEQLGAPVVVSTQRADLENVDALVLPGVGAFGQAMDNLRRLDLVAPLRDHLAAGKPMFGICLGLQLLFEGSEEFGNPEGLGVLRGAVRRLPVMDAPVPQIGWNRVLHSPSRAEGFRGTPLKDTADGAWMYFVHSFYVDNADASDALSQTEYAGFRYTSAVHRGTLFATQFHPEKSASAGLDIYRNWIASVSTRQ
jgi:glutamine amidotransferase